MTGVSAEWDSPSRQALVVPAGINRDQLLGVLVDRVPPDGRLVQVEHLDGDEGLRLWREQVAPTE